MSDTIWLYAEGRDFTAIEVAVLTRLGAFVEKRRWRGPDGGCARRHPVALA